MKTRSLSTSSRNELWKPRGGFEPPSSAGLYFESSVLTFLSRQENVVELRSPFQFYRYIYMLVNRAELNFPFFFPKLIKYKTSFRFKESPRTLFNYSSFLRGVVRYPYILGWSRVRLPPRPQSIIPKGVINSPFLQRILSRSNKPTSLSRAHLFFIIRIMIP